MRSALRCATFSRLRRESGCRLRNSTAATFDSYGQSTENGTLSAPSAATVQAKAGAEKLPLRVTTRFSVRYSAGVFFRRGSRPRLVVDAVEHEWQALAEVAQDERQLREGIEHAGKDQPQEVRAGLDAEAPGGERELLV